MAIDSQRKTSPVNFQTKMAKNDAKLWYKNTEPSKGIRTRE